MVEFFNLAKSIKGAQREARARYSGIAQLRAAGRARQDAASSTPTTSTSSTSSTGCCSTPSSSARATSTSSRGATPASCASASTACCTRSTRSRRRCCAAMTSRIKMLGAHGRGREAPAAGRPHQDAHAGRRRSRAAPVDHADRVRREAGDAHLRSRRAGQGLQRARLLRRRPAALERHDRRSRTASSWSPARPARARPPRSTRR